MYRSLHGQLRNIKKFALGQAKVRRALANVPTYMIFDDHDVTDDWNLNPEWCKRVFAADAVRKQPLGRQIVRNALASYALFQDWGNDLVRYAAGHGRAQQVLAQVQGLFVDGAPWPRKAAADELDRLFGLDQLPQPVDSTRPHGRHGAIDAPMNWHYTVEGPQFTVAVLDNRTRRGFASKFGPPGNVGTTMIDAQVPSAPLPAGQEVLIVVAPLQVLAPSVFDEIVAPGAYRAFDLRTPGKIGERPRRRGHAGPEPGRDRELGARRDHLRSADRAAGAAPQGGAAVGRRAQQHRHADELLAQGRGAAVAHPAVHLQRLQERDAVLPDADRPKPGLCAGTDPRRPRRRPHGLAGRRR